MFFQWKNLLIEKYCQRINRKMQDDCLSQIILVRYRTREMHCCRPLRNNTILWESVSVMLVFLFTFFLPTAAFATTHAVGSVPLSVTASRWGASAVPQGAPNGTGPLVMNWSVNQGIAYQYFDVVNSGSLAIFGQSFSVTNVNDKSGGPKPPTVTFEACVNGEWQSSTNSCSGSVVLMGSTTTTFFTSLNTPLNVNGRLSARARTSPGGSSTYTTTINVIVDRTQIRAGVTTHL